MSSPIDFEAIKALSIDERILLIQDIWDSIADEQGEIPFTQEQIDELDRRDALHAANPEVGLTWEEVKERLQRRQ